jgi:hypothetical protein
MKFDSELLFPSARIREGPCYPCEKAAVVGHQQPSREPCGAVAPLELLNHNSTVYYVPLVQYSVPLWKQGTKILPTLALLMLKDDVVDDAVFLRLIGIHDEVALHVALHLLEGLSAVLGKQLIRDLAHT